VHSGYQNVEFGYFSVRWALQLCNMKKSKIAIVTGGSRGLGKNISIALAKRKIDVLITYHGNKAAANEVVAAIEAMGQKAAAFQLDTGDTKQIEAFITRVTEHLQKENGSPCFDFLINNAGSNLYAPIAETTEQQLDAMFHIGYKGVFWLTQKSLPYINNGGAIVNISSGLARISVPGESVYASMKSAVETLTRYLAQELGTRQIRVNAVAPGAVETDFGGGITRDNKEANARIAGLTALGRAGIPDDIGGVVAFLCSSDAFWINGQRIEVAGGQSL